ncbi:MAG: HD domain-containing phosphohydrolase [Candidatus Omnitrophota bacterium]
MRERIECFLKDLLSLFQIAKIYTTAHPKFMEFLDKNYASLVALLDEKEELVIGVVGDELIFEKEIFFELSKKAKLIISLFKERGIEKIIFHRGLSRDELAKFVEYLALTRDKAPKDVQEYFSVQGIRNVLVSKLGLSSSEAVAVQPTGYQDYYDNSLERTSQFVDVLLDNKEVDGVGLKFTMMMVVDNLVGNYEEFAKLAGIKKYDVSTFTHLLNVSILSMNFAAMLGLSKDDMLDVGIAALFHDIGKIYISKRIITKPDKLSSEEFLTIQSHTIQGAEMLLQYVDTLGMLPAVVAFEHHLRYDMKGYPKLSFKQKPHIISLLVSICDVYDALMQRRTYKRDYPPRMIYDLMMRESAGAFDPFLLEKFFKIMGVWPRGTIVVLEDGYIAVVREENAEDIFFPTVEVLVPSEKKGILNLSEKKPGYKIERSLNPFLEGKEYLSLI